jgi:hypothetical protein
MFVSSSRYFEPVAIQYNFWSWNETIVPIKNYIAWFIISFIFCYAIAYYKGESKNNLAPYLLILQFMFWNLQFYDMEIVFIFLTVIATFFFYGIYGLVYAQIYYAWDNVVLS